MTAHSSNIHNSQNLETTQISIRGWMDKQVIVYAYNEILAIKMDNIQTHSMDNP